MINLNNLTTSGEHHFDTTYAKTNLDNLTLEGERHFLGRTHITNCITEVPQRINYTLNNGTLTIKAGSTIIVPYGTTDLSSTYTQNSEFLNANFPDKVPDQMLTELFESVDMVATKFQKGFEDENLKLKLEATSNNMKINLLEKNIRCNNLIEGSSYEEK